MDIIGYYNSGWCSTIRSPSFYAQQRLTILSGLSKRMIQRAASISTASEYIPRMDTVGFYEAIIYIVALILAIEKWNEYNANGLLTLDNSRSAIKRWLKKSRSIMRQVLGIKLLEEFLRPEVALDHVRITWTCHCGTDLWADFEKTEGESILLLKQRLQAIYTPHVLQNTSATNESLSADPGTSDAGHTDGNRARARRGQRNSEAEGFTSSNGRNDTLELDEVHSLYQTLSASASRPRYIELCVNTGQMCQSLGEIDVTDVWTDVQLFRKIRERYKELRGWRIQSRFFLRPCQMDFVNFVLEQQWRVSILETNSFPEESDVEQGDYEYRPCPMKPPPPMPSQAFIHWLHYCNLDREAIQRIWLDRLPKKINGSLLNSNDPNPEAWGIHVREGVNTASILWTMILTILLSIAPLAAYIAIVRDVQSAMSVGSAVLTIIGLLWYCMQVDIAKHE